MRSADLSQSLVEVFTMYTFAGANQGYRSGDCKAASLPGSICGIVWSNGITTPDIHVSVVEATASARFVGKSLKKLHPAENLHAALYLF